MLAITILTFYQVITRYVFNNASSWSEEAVRYLFVWVSMIGIAIGIREKVHIGIDIFVKRLPIPIKKATEMVVQIAIILLSFVLIIYGAKMYLKTASQVSPALNLPMKYVYLSAPICGILIAVYSLEQIYLRFKHRKEDEDIC